MRTYPDTAFKMKAHNWTTKCRHVLAAHKSFHLSVYCSLSHSFRQLTIENPVRVVKNLQVYMHRIHVMFSPTRKIKYILKAANSEVAFERKMH